IPSSQSEYTDRVESIPTQALALMSFTAVLEDGVMVATFIVPTHPDLIEKATISLPGFNDTCGAPLFTVLDVYASLGVIVISPGRDAIASPIEASHSPQKSVCRHLATANSCLYRCGCHHCRDVRHAENTPQSASLQNLILFALRYACRPK